MKNFCKNKLFLGKKNFSTLIVPEINFENGNLTSSYATLLAAAKDLKSPSKVLLYGNKVSEETVKKASYEVDEVFVAENEKLENATAENLSHVVSSLQNTHKFKNIITSSNMFGRNFLPRIGGLLNVEPISDISKVLDAKKFQRYIYAGNAISTIENSQDLNLLSIRLTSFEPLALNEPSSPKITKAEVSGLDSVRSAVFVENLVTKSDKPELGSAKIVISGGRALKSAENFKLLDDLAACFKGAAIGASRAAVDAGFCANDLQVGQTGKNVAPDLYIAIGISGAIQHIAGMKDSKCIVAINTDGEAPIFNVSFSLLFIDCDLRFSW